MNTDDTSIRQLSLNEIAMVSGGLKWQKGVKNDHVIDNRGGTVEILGGVFTAKTDPSGTITQVTFNPTGKT